MKKKKNIQHVIFPFKKEKDMPRNARYNGKGPCVEFFFLFFCWFKKNNKTNTLVNCRFNVLIHNIIVIICFFFNAFLALNF